MQALDDGDTSAFDLGIRLVRLATGGEETVILESGLNKTFAALRDEDINDEDAWRREMLEYVACAMIVMARCFSSLFAGQSVELFKTKVPVTCFVSL